MDTMLKLPKSLLILSLTSLFLASCSDSSSQTPAAIVVSHEITDTNAAADNRFGYRTVILDNGNIVLAIPYDSTVASNAGAVHLYNPYTKTVVASFYGDTASDQLGRTSITALGNNNFVIASSADDVNSVSDAGSVMLINGATGAQIGTTIAGDTAYDYLGSTSITALGNNNFVIASQLDDVNSVTNAGSIIQVDTTGTQVSIIAGAVTNDMSNISVTNASAHNFYVVSLQRFDNNSMTDSGLVKVVAY